ncbi:MAG: leucyl aminopeptidase [Magnetovibrio sp.]|nr:leucyl aminopeptidase [Magnetovibrio sp.]|tara:strand:- start:19017 stop:20519 length:1503 start_codon:yes stop_codon:yes gene_type:complete
MKITFSNPSIPETGVIVVCTHKQRKLCSSAEILDKKMSGGLVRAIKASRFSGSNGENLTLLAPTGTRLDQILVLGLGKSKDIDAKILQHLGGKIYGELASKGHPTVHVLIDHIEGCQMRPDEMAAEVAFGAQLRSYRFDKYRTKEKKEAKPSIKYLKFVCKGSAKARVIFGPKNKVAEGVFFTRDLVSEPANVLYPQTLAKQAQSLTKLGVKVEVLGEAKMRKLGMGALLGVGQGSVRESQLVIMKWYGKKGKSKKEPPLAFVGKGVTFDTGGISIKPSGGMEDMKWDMGGSGVVIGLMKALAGRKANANVVGVIGLVENMPSGSAQRPGDIVTSMSGQTIEVLNTDAEGRLVLADALWYTKKYYKPRFMVDLATLTGAIIISLGNEMAGLFSNDDKLSEQLRKAGEAVGENVWRMPLGDNYDKLINCDAADMKNISGGRGAGSITAAQFLRRFVDETPWAHLDIAGVTWSNKTTPIVPKGGTAFGVRLLDRLVADNYEK